MVTSTLVHTAAVADLPHNNTPTNIDAPEIDGNLFIDDGFEGLAPGDIVTVTVDEAGEYDLWGHRAG